MTVNETMTEEQMRPEFERVLQGQDLYGNTVMHYFALRKNDVAIAELLRVGGCMCIRNYAGQSAIDVGGVKGLYTESGSPKYKRQGVSSTPPPAAQNVGAARDHVMPGSPNPSSAYSASPSPDESSILRRALQYRGSVKCEKVVGHSRFRFTFQSSPHTPDHAAA